MKKLYKKADIYSAETFLKKKENKIDNAFRKAWDKTFKGLDALQPFISKNAVSPIYTWEGFLSADSLMAMQGLALLKALSFKEKPTTNDVNYVKNFTRDYLKTHEDEYRSTIENKLDYVKKNSKVDKIDELLRLPDDINKSTKVNLNLEFEIVTKELFGYLNGYVAKGESFVEIEQDLQKAINDGLISGETADMILGYVDDNLAFVLDSTRGDEKAVANELKEYLHVKKVYTMPTEKSITRLAKVPNSD